MTKNNEYDERKRSLELLGFENYHSYLKSSTWASIRRKIIKFDTECCCCSSLARQVHHRSYSYGVMCSGFPRVDLVPMCEKCHRAIEFVDGFHRGLSSANAHLAYLLRGGKVAPPKHRHRRTSRKKRASAAGSASLPSDCLDVGDMPVGSIITEYTILLIESLSGSATRQGLSWLGVSFPQPAGWRKAIVGSPRQPLTGAEIVHTVFSPGYDYLYRAERESKKQAKKRFFRTKRLVDLSAKAIDGLSTILALASSEVYDAHPPMWHR